MAEAAAKKTGVMDRTTGWINDHIVPVMNKIQNSYWFSIIGESVLYIVPFTLVSMIPSIWSIIRNYIPSLPDISVINTYSFGMVGLFVAFIIPYKVLVREEREDRALLGGCTSIGVFLLCMGAESTDDGYLFEISKFGAGGMFTAMVVGWFVGLLYKKTAHRSLFKDDSPFPDFVKNWFDNIFVIIISLVVGYIFTYIMSFDLFTFVGIIMSPVTNFAQSLPGVIFITLIMDVFYYFGISGWVFTSVTTPIQTSALAENAAAVAAGASATNIYAYGFTRFTMIGGEGATLPLAIMLLFSKSKRLKLLGKATIVPSLLNTNEPLFYSTVVQNPYMFIPIILEAIILPTNSWLWLHFGWASMLTESYGMYFLPNPITAYIASDGDPRDSLLVIVNLILATIIWFPFWKAYDNHLVKEEAKESDALEAKKAKRAARRAAAAAVGEDGAATVIEAAGSPETKDASEVSDRDAAN